MERTFSHPPFLRQLIELVQMFSDESGIMHYRYVLVVLRISGFSGIERAGPHP